MTKQYSFVQDSRKVLFDYCKTISPEDFIKETASFGRGGSIRNLLVHVATTYQYWIANHALKLDLNYTAYASIAKMQELITLFEQVDNFMRIFIERTQTSTSGIEYEIEGRKNIVEPIKLFTHVITHEFHHKGQILSRSRQLGYIPVDTDIMQ